MWRPNYSHSSGNASETGVGGVRDLSLRGGTLTTVIGSQTPDSKNIF